MEALLRESKKEKLTYKLEAMKCLGEVLEKFSVDKFSEVFSILSPVIVKVSPERLASILSPVIVKVSPERLVSILSPVIVKVSPERLVSTLSPVIVKVSQRD